jgi:DNA-binding Lrp family transcriptional regulator
VPDPWQVLADRLGIGQDDVLARLTRLRAAGVIARVGATVRPTTVGASTLAAMAVPSERLADVAALVSAQPEVTHNYEREHALNLWFVAVAPDCARLDAVLAAIAEATGLAVIDLPLVEDYHIDLGFPLSWT